MDRLDFLNKALRRVIEASAGLKYFHRETGQLADPRMDQLRKAKADFDKNLSELQKLFSKLFD